jgi:hypothetical protein
MSESADLWKEYAALGRQLTTLRQSLDTAQQALTIETSQQDTQVRSLIAKWKQVVRDAAEELFEDAKNNYRPDSSLSDKGQPFWEDEDHNQLTKEQKEILDIEQEEAKAQAERYGLLDTTESDSKPDSVSSTTGSVLIEPTNTQCSKSSP